MSKVAKVVICGGGNGAHASVASIGHNPNFEVHVFTRNPSKWGPQVEGITKDSAWESKGNFHGKVKSASDNPKDFPSDVNIWLICGPAHIHTPLLQKIAPFVQSNAFVGTIFGQGGFDWMCSYVFKERLVKENIGIFGLYNIPWICKIADYGKSVRIIGPKDALYVTCKPDPIYPQVIDLMQQMYYIKTLTIPNFLTLTLTPSNQIIHPGRIYAVFKDWDGKKVFQPSEIPMFYEDLDDFSGTMLENLDSEIQLIKKAINSKYPHYDLTNVLPMKERIIKQYGDQVKDRTNMKTVFRTNQGYKSVKIPVKEVAAGVIPNIDGRIFWEDIPYGLCILKDLAQMLSLQTPWVDLMIEWHQKFMNKNFLVNHKLNPELIQETGTPSKYQLKNIEEVLGISKETSKL